MSDEYYMKMALNEAMDALEADEVPVGAVVVLEDRIIARGHNLTETLKDVTAHAEMMAITAAVHGMDYLLSWNCRHLANPQTYPKTKKIVESFGLICPSIITPRSYLEDFNNAR